MSRILDEVRALVDRAGREAADDAGLTVELDRLRARLDEPLRVAIIGKVKAGKSTLLNALIGEELAPTDAGECTRVVTWYRNSHTYRVTGQLLDGVTEQLPYTRDEGALAIDLGGRGVDDFHRFVIDWPSSRLSEVTLIDTPGLGSITTAASDATRRFLALDGDAEDGEADAVVYLMRHLHRSDLDFLEAFHERGYATPTPINAVAVLSRADEVGACRIDSMQSARRIAERMRTDPRLAQLCQTIVPVAGLVAQAAVTLTESQYRNLRAISELDRAEADKFLLTVDRFVAERTDLDATPAERQELLDRLGLYGIRVSIGLIRLGAAPNASKLAAALRERSGIDELRHLLLTLFAERRDVLKARAALDSLDVLVRRLPPENREAIDSELERITASTHEFVEVQLLHAVRSGAVVVTDAERVEIEQLLGTMGAPLAHRLGIGTDDDPLVVIHEAITRWQHRAESPVTSRPVADLARAVTRSYEGLATLDH